MAQIMDYLSWRGDIPFSVSPLNDVDRYIICKLGTADWSGIVPEDARHVPLGRAAARFFGEETESPAGEAEGDTLARLLRRLPGTVRFGSLELSGFRLRISDEDTEQFSSLTVRLPGGQYFVTFRGTDTSFVGWKENCLMAVKNEVSAQRRALEYLRFAAESYPGRLLVGGHSKGGNLAVYAAARLDPAQQERVEAVYNFDGPGFQDSFLQSRGFLTVRSRIHTILSQNAMVGLLLTQTDTPTIVRTASVAISAHDGFTWECSPTGFVTCGELSPASRAFDESMTAVLAGMDDTRRTDFIDGLFSALGSTGARTVTELTEQRWREALAVAGSVIREPEVTRLVTELLENMVKNYAAEKTRGLNLSSVSVPFLRRHEDRDAEADTEPQPV